MTNTSFALAQRRHDRALPTTFGPSQERIDIIKKELLARGGECDPTDPQNFAEAISDASDTDLKRVCAFLNDGESLVVANLLRSISVKYWTEQAEFKATEQAEEEWAHE